jgi:hypothetical protein
MVIALACIAGLLRDSSSLSSSDMTAFTDQFRPRLRVSFTGLHSYELITDTHCGRTCKANGTTVCEVEAGGVFEL